jgi:feruloyl esterase
VVWWCGRCSTTLLVFTNEDTLLGNAVNAACDALEGVVDGVLNDPRRCAFNPDCKGSQKPPNCLTAKQVEAVRNIWTGTDQMAQQHNYYPPFERNGEADGWPFGISQPPPAQQTDHHAEIGIPFFEHFVFDNPNWDYRTFNWISDPAAVDKKVVVPGQTLVSVLNSINPDLMRFRAQGGKLIQYHGFSDPEVPPESSIHYFESLVKFPDASPQWTQELYRLFMVPGMNHCYGGPGQMSSTCSPRSSSGSKTTFRQSVSLPRTM